MALVGIVLGANLVVMVLASKLMHEALFYTVKTEVIMLIISRIAIKKYSFAEQYLI